LAVFPAWSVQLAFTVIGLPSPEETLLVVQCAGSIPEPPASSVQFQFTVTSLLFHPAAFAGGC
jgi:hypothetical protein